MRKITVLFQILCFLAICAFLFLVKNIFINFISFLFVKRIELLSLFKILLLLSMKLENKVSIFIEFASFTRIDWVMIIIKVSYSLVRLFNTQTKIIFSSIFISFASNWSFILFIWFKYYFILLSQLFSVVSNNWQYKINSRLSSFNE